MVPGPACGRGAFPGVAPAAIGGGRGNAGQAKGITVVTYIITEPCKGVKDASCVEVCPVDCIHSDDAQEMYFIDPDECIDCGACESVCPVNAIYYEEDTPEEWKEYLALNAAYFKQ